MLNAREVIEFLKNNPKFFEENEEILSELKFGSGNGATHFYERQLNVLKQRESQQQSKIDLIVDSAKNNQRLETDLLEMSIRLLSEGQNGNDPVNTVIALIKRQFNVHDAVVLLRSEERYPRHKKFDEVRQRVNHKSSVCDDRVSSKLLDELFEQEKTSVQSCAFVPLIFSDEITGVMVLGSNLRDRFPPDTGVVFLDRLGLLVGSYLQGGG